MDMIWLLANGAAVEKTYINIHTIKHLSGELQGTVIDDSETFSYSYSL
jgi:hypothetical protein